MFLYHRINKETMPLLLKDVKWEKTAAGEQALRALALQGVAESVQNVSGSFTSEFGVFFGSVVSTE